MISGLVSVFVCRRVCGRSWQRAVFRNELHLGDLEVAGFDGGVDGDDRPASGQIADRQPGRAHAPARREGHLGSLNRPAIEVLDREQCAALGRIHAHGRAHGELDPGGSGGMKHGRTRTPGSPTSRLWRSSFQMLTLAVVPDPPVSWPVGAINVSSPTPAANLRWSLPDPASVGEMLWSNSRVTELRPTRRTSSGMWKRSTVQVRRISRWPISVPLTITVTPCCEVSGRIPVGPGPDHERTSRGCPEVELDSGHRRGRPCSPALRGRPSVDQPARLELARPDIGVLRRL